ncbi:MAG: bifunctional YncE family protein/alkaline phosphatase family protein [Acidobacteriaceae bacterium]|nr:bifunctional YncE family protein/alkaline phosphatase family protein [Acidobacteriaceae bacterium]
MKSTHSRIARYSLAFGTLAVSGLLVLHSQDAPTQRVGPLPDGGFLLNSGWAIRPAGQQVPVDTFPISSAISDNGKYLLVLNSGYNPPSVSVIDVAQRKELGRTGIPDGWLGLTFAPGTNRVFVGGGGTGMVFELALDPDTGELKRTHEYAALPDFAKKGDAYIGDVAVDHAAHLLYAADLYDNSISVINLQSGQLISQWKCGRRPYRVLVAPGDHQIFLTSWADAAIYQYDANTGKEIGKTRVGAHPNDMVIQMRAAPTDSGEASSYIGRVFVSAGNTNTVYSLGITRDGQLTELESINVSLTPMHPLGMTPSALAISKGGNHLYVACSDANAVAVADISGSMTNVQGFIPTGWYPTAVRSLADGTLVVLNGKGLGSRANPDGPSPVKANHALYQGGPVIAPGYVAHIQTGTLSFIPSIEPDRLTDYSRSVINNSPYRDEILAQPINTQQEARFARTPGHAPPIQHVIYIIKENRTYDQVLGDLEKGNGDKSLTLFGEQYTPNLHQLARDFIVYDNFYENSDVSADGHNWANAAIAPDYTVRTWPAEYAGRRKNYDFEGTEPANSPPAGYIWDNTMQAGLTVRDYGEWDESIPAKQVNGPKQIENIHDPALAPYVDVNYRGWDLAYPDVNRAGEFIREWKEFDAKGGAPNFMVVRLGNDHTAGLHPGAPTPFAYAADNDRAVGLLVDAVSHSKLWPSTAIFVIEDDSQNGPDHVDSHRAPAFVISPYTRRGIVDSTMYNQMSILRTIELILGLRPMTHFDAGARPMFETFSEQPDPRPWNALQPKTSLTERNPANGPGSADSARMDFSEPDRVPDGELTAVLWRAIKHTDPPGPTRSAFAR